jgi:hypothetical protein
MLWYKDLQNSYDMTAYAFSIICFGKVRQNATQTMAVTDAVVKRLIRRVGGIGNNFT